MVEKKAGSSNALSNGNDAITRIVEGSSAA
jgi:hypothetical protein